MVSGLNGHGSNANGHTGSSPFEANRVLYARLKAIVLLGGSVRSGELSRVIGRSLLDLPVNGSQSVLSLWQDNAEELAAAAGVDHLQLRIVLSQSAREPTIPVPRDRVRLTVERDAREFRGTGGVLRDLADSYAPEDLILVANAAQILARPLEPLAAVMLRAGGGRGGVSFIAHKDGTPCGLFLVKCAALASIRDIGFLDFKEQHSSSHAGWIPLRRPLFHARPCRPTDGYRSLQRGLVADLRDRRKGRRGGPDGDPS
jgi:hypothetical protein